MTEAHRSPPAHGEAAPVPAGRQSRLEELSTKLHRVRTWLDGSGYAAALFTGQAGVAWVTAGLEDRVSRNEEPGLVWALVDASGLHLITTNVEGKRISAEEDLAGLGFDLRVTPWDRPGGLDAVASELTGGARLANDGHGPGTPVPDALAGLRLPLTPREGERLAALGPECAEALEGALREWRPAERECELAARIAAGLEERRLLASLILVGGARRRRAFRHPIPTDAVTGQDALAIIVAARRPGQVIEEEAEEGTANAEANDASQKTGAPQGVVLKIRRRKFLSTPQKGEVVITRRLFRTGESEYLLNGKLCRLRDIQDIFMGTGLGPECYAIIGQERIGQLLSSKPYERRAIIEEAAGVTRYKNKKRLAELRLESAKQNLARVDDIFEEVTRQMNSLKRQAAKAERYAAVREELRGRLRVVLASRMATMDLGSARLEQEIAALTERVSSSVETITRQEATQHALTERGYELDHEGETARDKASEAAVELERATARERGNTERVAELEARIAAATAELEQTRLQMAGIEEERAQHRSFLEHCSRRGARVPAEGRRAPAPGARCGRRGIYGGAGTGSWPPPRHAPAYALR